MSRLNSTIAAETMKAVLGYMNNRYGRCHLYIDESLVVGNPNRKALVPYVQNGYLVLNIGGSAVKHLVIDQNGVSFEGRFGGNPLHCHFEHDEIMGAMDFDTQLLVLTNVLLGTRMDGTAFNIVLREPDEIAAEDIAPIDDKPQVTAVKEGNVVHLDFGKKK